VRAIIAASADDAFYGRNDNDANVLCLPARILNNPDEDAIWKSIVDTFLTTEFANATRYVRRNRELDELA
jgi:ribose 5-phosphate isomerase B